ncbi:MAG TPA: NAD-dependent epimerase/dehydratase family protein [Longimicrobiales bacterium]|nr:NAD-dependent epimerase/dehydratase family protein [Longimicrobiales bacterium]
MGFTRPQPWTAALMGTGPQRVLVTGGAGFIGSHVVDAYLARGCAVTVLDSLVRGRRDNVPAGATFVQADIRDDEAARVIRDGRFHIINNHAAQIDVRASVDRPRHDASVNIDGLLNLMQAAIDARVPRFIQVSSGGVVYGTPDTRPTVETAPKRPESPYGVSKLAGEHYLFYAHRVHGLDYRCVRYANVYGPRQDPEGEAGVIAIFAMRLLAGQPITIYGDGEQTRDYVAVEDVAAANMLLSGAVLEPARSIDDRAFNVGTGVETSVNRLAALVMAAVGHHVMPLRAPARPGELLHSSLCADRLHDLGWSPRTSLDQGLRRTAQWIARTLALSTSPG